MLHSARLAGLKGADGRSMPKILIIADDLTGAADCGVVFARRGMEANVVLSRAGEDLAHRSPIQSPMLAIDADTRRLGPSQATRVVALIVNQYANEGALVFKKVDSTLRGNVGAELAGALLARRANATAGERVAILFAPAFPAHCRTTVGGRQMVNGRLLEEKGVGRGLPASIGAMLSEAGLSYRLAGLETVRAGAGPLRAALRCVVKEADVAVCDAETEDDLRAIANAGMALGPGMIWAGSAGLARHIPHAAQGACDSDANLLAHLQVHGPTLFVVGSATSVSREQASALAAASDLCVFTLPGGALKGGVKDDAARIAACLARGKDVLVRLDSSETVPHNLERAAAQALGRMLQPCGPCVGALVATGGETARAVLDAWGIESLRLLGEVETGLPFSVSECAGRSLLILTKAGGFGTRDTLLGCRDFVRRLANNEIAGLHAGGRKR